MGIRFYAFCAALRGLWENEMIRLEGDSDRPMERLIQTMHENATAISVLLQDAERKSDLNGADTLVHALRTDITTLSGWIEQVDGEDEAWRVRHCLFISMTAEVSAIENEVNRVRATLPARALARTLKG